MKRTAVAIPALFAVLAYSSPSVAQQATAGSAPEEAADEMGVQDIIVTAERHSQSAQRAALAIQVVGGDDAVKAGLSTAADLTKLTTGLEVSAGGASTQLFVRGVGDASFNPLANPGVAFNVDGVYVARPGSIGGNFYDIARIEMLKGPQGTLYGRNANGGSINLITNEPVLGERSASLNLEAGNYELAHVSGAINLPLGQDVAIRGAFNILHRNGYLSDGTNDDNQQSARIRLKWAPDPDVSLLLNADYNHADGIGAGYVWLPMRPGAGKWEGTASPEAIAYRNSFLPLGPLLTTNAPPLGLRSEQFNFSAQLDWSLGFATLTVLPAYRHSTLDTNSFPTIEQGESNEATQNSLEVRLGNSSSRINWVVGGFYFTEKGDGFQTDRSGDLIQNVLLTYKPKTDAYAMFGQTTFTVLDGLRLIAGARYTTEKRRLDGALINQSPLTGGPGQELERFNSRASFDGFTYKGGLEYDVGPRSLFYVTVSSGFKAGGLNQTVAPLDVYQPERLLAYEVGSKNRFFDNRLQVNLTAFRWSFKQLQDQRLTFDPTGNINFLFFNVGRAEIKGATADIVAKPTIDDTLSVSVEYADSKYKSFIFRTPAALFLPGSTGCPTTLDGADIKGDCSGFDVARVPKWSGTVAMQHVFHLPGDATIELSGSMKFAGRRWLTTDFVPSERVNAYAIFDSSLTYRSPNGYSIGVFGRNLGNKAYFNGAIQQPFIPGLIAASISAPRTYGVQASFNF